ncbi:MAG TPA: hypothetical protein VFQ75_04555 [Candidatus Limnocylindrales bacterium]|jgi:hypothetical protein|nr:hypothetical protein [Candidatus Limnocylindrales bacterium]
MYLGLLLGIGGLGSAASTGLLLAPWALASYAVVVVTLIAMWAMGAGFCYPLREGLEGTDKTPRLEDAELHARIAGSRRPEALAAVRLTSLTVLVVLMALKPG